MATSGIMGELKDTGKAIGPDGAGNTSTGDWAVAYLNVDGFDLIWRQKFLQQQMGQVEDKIRKIESDANMTDTEKMFSMQMAMNAWSAISNLRTNVLKTVADTLKAIARNVA